MNIYEFQQLVIYINISTLLIVQRFFNTFFQCLLATTAKGHLRWLWPQKKFNNIAYIGR